MRRAAVREEEASTEAVRIPLETPALAARSMSESKWRLSEGDGCCLANEKLAKIECLLVLSDVFLGSRCSAACESLCRTSNEGEGLLSCP